MREAGFWHVATIGRGCKLDPKLINALIQRWRLEKHTFPSSMRKVYYHSRRRAIAIGIAGRWFQWTPHEDPAIRAVIPDDFFQNPNIWHVKVLLLLNTDWPRHWTEYIEMWENRYDYIPTQEPVIVPELACVPKYMPWFRIHGKPYLLLEEERQRLILVQRERRGSLNLRRRDDDAGLSVVPTQSPGPSTAPTQPPVPTFQPKTPISQPFQIMPGAYPSPYMYPNPFIFPLPSPMAGWNAWPDSCLFPITPSQPPINRPPSHKGPHNALSGSSSFYHSPLPYGIQTPPPWVMQTSPHSLFYQGGSFSKHPQQIPCRRNHNPYRSNHNPGRKLNQ
ncbi:hypothetical protein PVK06_024377 [Gossypium arboreum]|uniref:Serine/threonine-protein phosphatase 7 long form homolog n=1 Tax=Gossypium arboreum TaxID=29729 RepID=A0ABR0PDY3_GOSAR|nr:hypothetical protein PVK06_024377 [Gossypium arboreum]